MMTGAVALGLMLMWADTAVVGPPLWLAGHWVEEETDGTWTEERWGEARGGAMLGTSLSGSGDRATGFEFMRIVSDEAGLAFWGSPGGAPAVRFGMTHVESRADGGFTIVFENPAHDYPQRVEYLREGETLIATVSAADGGNPMRWSFRAVE